jgi:hypothetical protein
MFVMSIIAAIECCLMITFPQKIFDFISRFENGGEALIKQESAGFKFFAVTDLLVRVILPILLLFSSFKRFHIYGWILVAEFLFGNVVMLKIKEKNYYPVILISALELFIFIDIIRSCYKGGL